MSIKAPRESALYQSVINLCLTRGIRAWRNQTTGIYDPKLGRFRKFHGLKGVSDIIGVLPVSPTHQAGRALFIEMKLGKAQATVDQLIFLADMTRRGAVAFVAHSLREVEIQLEANGY